MGGGGLICSKDEVEPPSTVASEFTHIDEETSPEASMKEKAESATCSPVLMIASTAVAAVNSV